MTTDLEKNIASTRHILFFAIGTFLSLLGFLASIGSFDPPPPQLVTSEDLQDIRLLKQNLVPINQALLATIEDRVLDAVHEVTFDEPSETFRATLTTARRRLERLSPVLKEDPRFKDFSSLVEAMSLMTEIPYAKEKYTDALRLLDSVQSDKTRLKAVSHALKGALVLVYYRKTSKKPGDLDKAEEHFETAIALAKDEFPLGLSHNGLGVVTLMRACDAAASSNHDDAISLSVESMKAWKKQDEADGTLSSFQKKLNNGAYATTVALASELARWNPKSEKRLATLFGKSSFKSLLEVLEQQVLLAYSLEPDAATRLTLAGVYALLFEYWKKVGKKRDHSQLQLQRSITIVVELAAEGRFGKGDGLPSEVVRSLEQDPVFWPILRDRSARSSLERQVSEALFPRQTGSGLK